jgi:hypothetical protein
MDFLSEFLTRFVEQLRSPTLGFLIAGVIVAALGSRLVIPDAIYKFIVFMLLMKVGLEGGISIREANLAEMALPAGFAIIIGILIAFIGRNTLAKMPGVKVVDGIATGGLFGAVSGSTLAAALSALEGQGISYEAWSPALYPFMDIPALVTAIVFASIYTSKQKSLSKQESLSKQPVAAGGNPSEPDGPTGGSPSEPAYPTSRQEYREQQGKRVQIWPIVKESLQGSALSALLLGIALGMLTEPESVFDSFYEPLFRGLLSVLMLVMGMEAWARLSELFKVAQWFAIYAFFGPLLHGLIGFGFGYLAHIATGFSPGGVVVLAVIASSNSDISGPPTLRAGIPSANPSAYIGASTALGTPIAIALGIPLYIGLAQTLMGAGG